jgi:hypothetical protein
MEKIIVDLEVKSKEGVKEVEKLNKELSNTKTGAKDAGKSLDAVSGGAVSKFKGLQGSIGGVVKGFKSLKFAIIASGIGALLLAVIAVGKAFTSSEEGQNKFAKILGVIGSVTGNLIDLLSDFGELIIGLFSGDSKAIKSIKSFGKKLFDLVGLPIKNVIDIVKSLGSALGALFSGDISGAFEQLKKGVSNVKDNFKEAVDVIKGATNAVKDFTKEVLNDSKIAANIADQRAKADKLERALLVERAKANRDRADLLDKAAQKEKFTSKERIEFLTEAGKIEDEITAKEIIAAKLRYDAKVLENSLSKSTKEDLLEEANLKANLINLETAKLTKQKLVSSQIVGAKREEATEIKAIEDKALADKKAIEELEANTEEEKRVLALEKEKIKFEDAILLATEQGLSTEELERSQKESLQLMRDGFAQTDLDRAAKIAATKKLIDDKAARDAQVIAEKTLIDAKIIADAKVNTLNMSANAAIQIAGRESKIGKSIAVAQAIWNTKNAITKTLATVPAPFNIPQAIATGIFGLAQVKDILKTPTPLGGGSGGSVPSMASAMPPAFNTIGTGATSANQQQAVTNNQSQQPIQAYVVSGDVTTAQQMDRNIIEGASI